MYPKLTVTFFIFINIISFVFVLSAADATGKINIQGGISLYPDPRHGPEIYVEFPFAVHRNQFALLPGEETADGLIGGVYAALVLNDSTGPIDSASITFYIGARDSLDAQDENIRLFNQLSLMMPPGVYSATLTVVDIVGKSEGSFLYDRLEIDPIVGDKMNLSSLEIAYRIRIADDSTRGYNERLVKNGREVIPNPMGVFSVNDSELYVYSEIYNLHFDGRSNDSISLKYHIFTSKNISYYNFGELRQAKPGSTAVITNILNIAGFDPDRYILRLIAEDLSSGQADTVSARFIVFPRTGALEFAEVQTYKYPYDTISIETKRRLTKYLMAPQQLAMLNSLNDSGKVRFVNQFFKDKDPDPTTDVNEFLHDLYGRYLFVNNNFSSAIGKDNGWKSDRGRVLLQYGPWDDRMEAVAPSMGNPWELWSYYSLQGGVVFVFQDADGYGDFRLVHSDAIGEIYDSEWDRFLKEYDPKTYKEGFILPDLQSE